MKLCAITKTSDSGDQSTHLRSNERGKAVAAPLPSVVLLLSLSSLSTQENEAKSEIKYLNSLSQNVFWPCRKKTLRCMLFFVFTYANAEHLFIQRPQARSRADADRWIHDKAPNGARLSPNLSTPAEPNSTIIVKNLHYNVTPKDLVVRTTFMAFLRSHSHKKHTVNFWPSRYTRP